MKLAHLLPLRVGYRVGSAPPLGIEAATPRTQHPRRDQRETPHRTPPGHRPPTRRTTPGPLTEQPTHRSRIGRFDTWFSVDSTHWSQLHSPAGGDEFASKVNIKEYKVVTTTEFSVDERASTEQKMGVKTPVSESGDGQPQRRDGCKATDAPHTCAWPRSPWSAFMEAL